MLLGFVLASVFSASVVPMGLAPYWMHNPGTEVPGYFNLVPTGREMGPILASPLRALKVAKLRPTLQARTLTPHVSANRSFTDFVLAVRALRANPDRRAVPADALDPSRHKGNQRETQIGKF